MAQPKISRLSFTIGFSIVLILPPAWSSIFFILQAFPFFASVRLQNLKWAVCYRTLVMSLHGFAVKAHAKITKSNWDWVSSLFDGRNRTERLVVCLVPFLLRQLSRKCPFSMPGWLLQLRPASRICRPG